VLVTGGAGFVGSGVIYRGNICDMPLMTSTFENERPQWVCHMAARAGVRPSIDDPFIYIQSNIVGTTLLMELASKFKIENFVFASSSSVYGGSKSTYFSRGRERGQSGEPLRGDEEGVRASSVHLPSSVQFERDGASLLHRVRPPWQAGHGAVPIRRQDQPRRRYRSLETVAAAVITPTYPKDCF